MRDLNAFPQYPTCGFCKDHGLTHDEFNGFRFCACVAGRKRAASDPRAAEDANALRERLGVR